MIKKITIKNYKSIHDLTLELGHFNVFIGENGSGKTNILEAVALLSGASNNRLEVEDLVGQGVRVAQPNLTFNSFLNVKADKVVNIETVFEDKKTAKTDTLISKITCESPDDFYTKWFDSLKHERNFTVFDLFNEIFSDKKETQSADFISLDKKIEILLKSTKFDNYIKDYIIYNLDSQALRGVTKESLKQPLGIHGENLDTLLSTFTQTELKKLEKYNYVVNWLNEIIIDKENEFKHKNHLTGGNSILFFSDKFMKKNSQFNIANANEGILHILFYLALFISKKTPEFFAIDNIETALNPSLCRHLTEILSTMNTSKQALITTHNPAILDGLDLTNDGIRLFEVKRNDSGYTTCRRIQFKKGVDVKKYKLSEMWMKGLLGATPKNF